jgi:hypothetical protein
MILMPDETFKFPKFSIVIPVVCTGLLLFLGSCRPGNQRTLLEGNVLNFIGDRSYSIYLWHWPFLVFANYLFPNSFFIKISAIFLSFCIALLAFRYIETPVRGITIISPRLIRRVLVVFLCIPLVSSAALGYVSSEILFDKYQTNVEKSHIDGDIGATGFIDFSSQFPSSCGSDSIIVTQDILRCDIDVLLIGDSHARHLMPGFVSNFPRVNFAAIDPLIVTAFQSSEGARLLEKLKQNKTIKLVIFSSYWAQNGVPPYLPNLIKEIDRAGKKVLIVEDTPNFPFDAFTCKYGLSPFLNKNYCEMPARYYQSEREIYLPNLREAFGVLGGAGLIDVGSMYCNVKTCTMVRNSQLHFMDMNHLNSLGSKATALFILRSSPNFCDFFAAKLGKNYC